MIPPQLIGHISQEQIDLIVDRIVERYREYLSLTKSPNFKKIFAEEYSAHRKQHTLSWAIFSAFPSNETIGGLQISCPTYNGGHKRPVLSNDVIEIYILSETTNFDAKYLKECYAQNSSYSNQKLFCYFKFHVQNNQLISISLCLPDETGKTIVEESLFDQKANLKRIA